MKKILECVPNFSEGRNMDVIKEITNAIESVAGIKLLDVDPGKATNRTVVTFVGGPDDVVEAAFRGIKKAAEVMTCRKIKENTRGLAPRLWARLCRFLASPWTKPWNMPVNWLKGWGGNWKFRFSVTSLPLSAKNVKAWRIVAPANTKR
jgi:hypothetical protein